MRKLVRMLCLGSVLSVAVSPWVSALPPTRPGEPVYLCYEASIYLDYNCDGQFDAGSNDGVSTYQGCLTRVQQKIQQAQANGYCYSVPSPNCTSYSSSVACRY